MTVTAMGKVAPTTPGTPAVITADSKIVAGRVMFAVPSTNTGKVYLGQPGMNKTTLAGVIRDFTPAQLGPQDGTVLWTGDEFFQLSEYVVDADVAGEGLLVTYWLP